MDLYTLTTNIVFGATAGYITNNFAIKMLFKNYGPLGGVILKTKEEFIKNTSQLIEREIINHHTLEDKLESKEMKMVINEIVSEILEKKLPQRLEEKKFENIPEIENTLSNILEYVFENESILNIDKKYQISNNIFEKEQLRNIITNVYAKLLKGLKDNNNLVEELSHLIYTEISDEKLNNLIDKDLLAKLESNINNETKNINLFLKNNFDEDLEKILNDIYEKLGINQTTKKILYDFIKENNDLIDEKLLSEVLSVFIENIILILKKENGKKYYNRLINSLIKDLNNSDIKFVDIIGIEENEVSKNFINEEKDYFLHLMQYWLEYNEKDIESLLDETLMEVLEEGSGFKNSLQKFLYSFLGEEGVAKYEPVVKLKKILQEKSHSIDGFSELKILSEKYGPGELLQFLFENEILNANKLTNLLENNKKEIINYIIKNISIEKITDFISRSFNDLINNNLQKFLITTLKQEYIYSPELANEIENISSEYFSNIKNEKVNNILNQEIYNKYIPKANDYLLAQLKENRKEVIDFFVKYIAGKLNDKNNYLGDLNLKDYLFANFNDFMKESDDKYWKKVVQKIENSEDFSNKVVESLLSLVEDNLSKILDGKIEKTVASSLNNLNDEDLQRVVEDFVGRELKPITIFGGGLGALGGIALYFLENLGTFSSILSSGPLLSVLIYALIGYLTNVIAIWMIFHPYQEKNIFSYSLPLTPGVVAQNKGRFAQSMGKFVDEQLLDANSVTKILGGKKEDLIEKIQKLLAKDNYAEIDSLLKNNSDKIIQIISENIFKFIDENEKKVVEFITTKISELNISIFPKILKNIDNDNLTGVSSKYLADLLYSEINNLKKGEKSIGSILNQKENSFLTEKTTTINQKLWNDILEKDKYLNSNMINKDQLKKILKSKINKFIKSNNLNGLQKNINLKKNKSLSTNKKIEEYLPCDIIKISKNNNISAKVINKTIQIYVNKNREVIKRKFLELIKNKIEENNNSLLGSLMFNLSGIDDLANSAVDHFIDNKLSDFLTEKEDSLEIVAEEFLNDILTKEIGETGLYLKENISTKISKDENNLMIKDNINELSNIFIDELFEKDISYYQKRFDFIENKDFNYEAVINNLESNLKKSLENNKKEIKSQSFKLMNELFQEKFHDIKFENLLADISKEELYHSFEKLFKIVKNDKLLDRFSANFKLIFAGENLKSYIDENKLNKSIEKIISNNKEEIKNDFQRKTPKYLNKLIELSQKETLNYFSLLFLETSFDSLENNFIDLINAFEIKEITESEIEEMTSEEIEDLFYSFAGKYMNRLKIYGFSGGGFGFISEIILKYILS